MSKPLSKEELDDKLCSYCPAQKEGSINTNQWNLCEGSYCDEAYECYLDEFEGEL